MPKPHYLFEESFELITQIHNVPEESIEDDEADDFDDPLNILIRREEESE